MEEKICAWCNKPASRLLGPLEPHLAPLVNDPVHARCGDEVMIARSKVSKNIEKDIF